MLIDIAHRYPGQCVVSMLWRRCNRSRQMAALARSRRLQWGNARVTTPVPSSCTKPWEYGGLHVFSVTRYEFGDAAEALRRLPVGTELTLVWQQSSCKCWHGFLLRRILLQLLVLALEPQCFTVREATMFFNLRCVMHKIVVLRVDSWFKKHPMKVFKPAFDVVLDFGQTFSRYFPRSENSHQVEKSYQNVPRLSLEEFLAQRVVATYSTGLHTQQQSVLRQSYYRFDEEVAAYSHDQSVNMGKYL